MGNQNTKFVKSPPPLLPNMAVETTVDYLNDTSANKGDAISVPLPTIDNVIRRLGVILTGKGNGQGDSKVVRRWLSTTTVNQARKY